MKVRGRFFCRLTLVLSTPRAGPSILVLLPWWVPGVVIILMPQPLPILYIKPECPWCVKALAYFAEQGVALDVRDVIKSMHDMRQMVALTGQAKCPSFRYGDFIVADFAVEEFVAKAKKFPSVCKDLGLKL